MSFKFHIVLILSTVLPFSDGFAEDKTSTITQNTVGIEVNPFRLLDFEANRHSFSGSINFFNVEHNAEIAIPVYYGYSRGYSHIDFFELAIDPGTGDLADPELSRFLIDLHYRKFFGEALGGVYVSLFARYTQLRGNNNTSPNYSYEVANRLGAGIGLGYRYISEEGWYWGIGVQLGAYSKRGEQFYTVNIDDDEIILDFEFAKIGFLF